MKLHSKLKYIGEEKPKGRVGTLIGYSDSHKAIVVEFEGEDGGVITTLYRSLAELNEEWEDYTPQEPLIKDKNIRKVVRDWAKINAIDRVQYTIFNHPRSYRFEYNRCDDIFAIDFVGWIPELKREGLYIITELCGE